MSSCPGCNTGGIFPHAEACPQAGERERQLYRRNDDCMATRDFGHGVILTCEKPKNRHGVEHLSTDEQGRRTWWTS